MIYAFEVGNFLDSVKIYIFSTNPQFTEISLLKFSKNTKIVVVISVLQKNLYSKINKKTTLRI